MVMVQPQNGWVIGQGGFGLVPIRILLMVQKSGQPVDMGESTMYLQAFLHLRWCWLVVWVGWCFHALFRHLPN